MEDRDKVIKEASEEIARTVGKMREQMSKIWLVQTLNTNDEGERK